MVQRPTWLNPGLVRLIHAALAGLFLLAVGACEKSPVTKAQEWIAIKNYSKARQILESAIEAEPDNIPARVMIARSYLVESGDAGPDAPSLLQSALTALSAIAKGDETEAANTTRADIFKRLSNLARSEGGGAVLSVVRRHKSSHAFDVLEALIASADRSAALAAGEEMFVRDRERARDFLIGQLKAGDPLIQRRSARILWTRERFEPARQHVIASLLSDLPSIGDRRQAEVAVNQIEQLGYEDAAPGLVSVLQRMADSEEPSPAALAVASVMMRRGSRDAADAIGTALQFGSVKEAETKGCSPSMLELAAALGGTKLPEAQTALKTALSRVLLTSNRRCMSTYLGSLAKADKSEWKALPVWYETGNWSIFGAMISGRLNGLLASDPNAFDGNKWKIYGKKSRISRRRIRLIISRLRKHKPGGKRNRFTPDKLTLETPKKAVLRMVLATDTGAAETTAVGNLEIVLEATGTNPKQPWTVTGVTQGEIGGRRLFGN